MSGGRWVRAARRSTSSVSVAPQMPVRRILALRTILRAIRVGRAVHIGVADAVEMLEHGDAALGGDPLDQRPPAARHDDVDEIVELQERADRRPVGGGDELDRGLRQAGGRSPSTSAAWIARAECRLSLPPRKIAALPDLRQSAAGIGGHVGPASKMMPITPNGTRMRAMSSPLGRVQRASTVPIGSGWAATSSSPRAIASTRAASSASRSQKAALMPFAASRSRRLAARIVSALRAHRRGRFGQGPVLGLGRGEREHGRGRLGLLGKAADHAFDLGAAYGLQRAHAATLAEPEGLFTGFPAPSPSRLGPHPENEEQLEA